MSTRVSGGGSARRRCGRPRASLRTVVAPVMLGVLGCGVTGCVGQDVADTVNQRMNHGMTTSELTLADSVALQRVRAEGARVTARATVSGPAASAAPSVPPAPCSSGRLLHLTLAGHFPHHPFADAARTTRVSAQLLTVDARTGRVCAAHFVSGLVVNDPTSVLLFSTLS